MKMIRMASTVCITMAGIKRKHCLTTYQYTLSLPYDWHVKDGMSGSQSPEY